VPPALTPVTPTQLRDILLDFGYEIERETEFNWSLIKKKRGDGVNAVIDDAPPIIIPKEGERVALDVMMNALLVQARMPLDVYWRLKEKHVPAWQNYPELRPPNA
jgi:hypothetical protein